MRPSDQIVVIGGGASGLMAAIAASMDGNRVILLEKNEKLGKKIYITGKGRCNFTNACDTEDIFSQVVTNAKFLYSSIYGLSNQDIINLFNEWGLKSKEERGRRMFPASDKASDVTKVLAKKCADQDVDIRLYTEVTDILTDDCKNPGSVRGVKLTDGTELPTNHVILATGGVSYPTTGSTGDGHRMASELGHDIVGLRPGLTGFTSGEGFVKDIQGLTLKNVKQVLWDNSQDKSKKVYEDFGEIMFTHFGVTGPGVLTMSSVAGDRFKSGSMTLELDIKPALSDKQLDERLLREIDSAGRQSVGNMLRKLLPKSLIPVLTNLIDVDEEKRAIDLTAEERGRLVNKLKHFRITVTGTRGFEEAIITRGGVSVKNVNPHNMESKIISGLYLCGELLDVDALTGGFNLQIAWSTGWLAGRSCADDINSH